jgi:hypothetical protein
MGIGARRVAVTLGLARLRPAGVVLVIGGGLALLPFTTCISRLAFDVPCPACGLTRAGLALLRGNVGESLHYHPLAIPLLTLFAVACALALTATEPRWRAFVRLSTGLAAAGLVIVWLLRFAGFFGGPVP